MPEAVKCVLVYFRLLNCSLSRHLLHSLPELPGALPISYPTLELTGPEIIHLHVQEGEIQTWDGSPRDY